MSLVDFPLKTQLPLFVPESNWQMAEVLPDFASSKYIGVDIETYDPYLSEKGPGFVRGDAHIVGITSANEQGLSIYLPIKHPGTQDYPESLIRNYLKIQLTRPNQPKIGAHLLYDLEGLHYFGVDPVGPFYDILIAEPLIDEAKRQYNLDRLSERYLGRGKEYTLLREAVSAYCGSKKALSTTEIRKSIYKVPAKFVAEYAEADGTYPIEIFLQQRDVLEDEGLWNIFMLETDLIPMLLEMRIAGCPVDLKKAELVKLDLARREKKSQAELERMTSMRGINVWSSDELGRAFNLLQVPHPLTKTGKPSFDKDWLKENPHPLPQLVLKIRKLNRIGSVFVDGVVIKHSVKGRIHCQFHQMRSDDGGTVSGRFSSSNPNLQQVPAPDRDPELAPLVRGLFVPEEGHDWDCDDYSQIEPRLQVHYAYLLKKRGAEVAAEKYRSDPKTDFHSMTAALTGLPRRPAKTIHLGLSYGMGLAALAANLGIDLEEARRLKDQYNQYMPFLDDTAQAVNRRAANVGYIRTLLGRRARFDTWEPSGRDRGGFPVNPREEALEKYGPPVRRAHTRKAFNRLIQGGAADIMKKAMVDMYKSGIFKELPMTHVTVHDEIGQSIPKTARGLELRKEVVNIMKTCVKLEVPLQVDCETGPSWGEH